MLGLPSTTLLVGKYEVGEPRLLGQGRYGPVIRARDVHSRELVAVKVFNAAEAFHSGRLQGSASLAEAEVEALRQFSHEVQLLQRVGRGGGTPALGGAALTELPSCSDAVVTMLDYSKDQGGRPGRAADGCCYLVLELGLFTMEQLARDSREVGRRPSVPEVREAVGSLLGMVATLHRCGCVLASHSPRHVMRFPSGWKLLAVDELRPADTLLQADPAAVDPLYLSPEFASALLARSGHVQLRPSMDVWGVTLVCLELLLPTPLLQEPHARVLTRNPHDPDTFLRWLSHGSGALALPAAVHALSPALQSLLQLLLHRDAARRIGAEAALQHSFFTAARGGPAARRRANAATTTPASTKLRRSEEGAAAAATAAAAAASTPSTPSTPLTPLPNKQGSVPKPGGGGGAACEAELEKREAAAVRRKQAISELAQVHRATTEKMGLGLQAKPEALPVQLQALQALQAQLQAAQQSGAGAQATVDQLHAQLQTTQQALQASQTVAAEQKARAVAAEREVERLRLRVEPLQRELAVLQQQQRGEAVPQLRAALDTAQAELQDALEAAQAQLQGAAVRQLLGPPPESAAPAPVPGSASELGRLREELHAARQETIAVARAAGAEVAATSAAAGGSPPAPPGVSSGEAAQLQAALAAAQEALQTAREAARLEAALLQARVEAAQGEAARARAELAQVRPRMLSAQLNPRPHPKQARRCSHQCRISRGVT